MPYIPPSKSSVQLQHQRMVSSSAAAAAAAAQQSPPQLPERCTAHEVPEEVARHHEHYAGAGQCCSAVVQSVSAPVPAVWSVVRRFDAPQSYKRFVRSCHVIGCEGGGGGGDGGGVHVGALREVRVVSGLPAAMSRERLEILDDERHVLSFRMVGGDHRLANYRSVTTLHVAGDGVGTVVVESYVVDVPPGNTVDDTRLFVDTIVRCNLHSLARTAEKLARATAAAPNANAPNANANANARAKA